MFQVKICGVTQLENARQIAAIGPDAIGLNFYPPSPRYVSIQVAAEIVQAVADSVLTVAVVVNMAPREIMALIRATQVGAIQIHGDESPAELVAIRDVIGEVPIIRALRCGSDLTSVTAYLDECQARGCLPDALLMDASAPGLYGGSGETNDWQAVGNRVGLLRELPVILAGGLRPDNVAAAIQSARPVGVDTAGGVELKGTRQPGGIKDLVAVQQFIAEARRAIK